MEGICFISVESVDAELDTDITSGFALSNRTNSSLIVSASTARVGLTCSIEYNKVNVVYLVSTSAAASEFTTSNVLFSARTILFVLCFCFCERY